MATGKFDVNSSGELVDLNGGLIAGGESRAPVDLSRATAVVITIEPDGDIDAIPAECAEGRSGRLSHSDSSNNFRRRCSRASSSVSGHT